MAIVKNTYKVARAVIGLAVSGLIAGGSWYGRARWVASHVQDINDALVQIGVNPTDPTLARIRDRFISLVGGHMPNALMVSELLRILMMAALVFAAVYLCKTLYRLVRWTRGRKSRGAAADTGDEYDEELEEDSAPVGAEPRANAPAADLEMDDYLRRLASENARPDDGGVESPRGSRHVRNHA